jgi:hypothetical protein
LYVAVAVTVAAGSEDAESIHIALNKNLTLTFTPVIYFTHTRGIWVESEKVYACRKTRCT